jgi:hypothetical protein
MTERTIDDEMAAAAEILERDVGTWDAVVEFRQAPGAAPQLSRGMATSRRCGGRWLVTDFRNATGFEGHGVYGWDPVKRRYTGVWVDSARSFIALSEGTYDAGKQTMTYVTQATVEGRQVQWREVTEAPDPDVRIYRSYMPGPGGRQFEMMRITYTRRR